MSRADRPPVTKRSVAGPATERSFASATVADHLRRGAVGFSALALALFLWPRFGLIALAPAAIGVVVLRGCPMCWTIGLIQTVTRHRLRRDCTDGSCRLATSRPDATRAGSTLCR
jgi:hypothetical protein